MRFRINTKQIEIGSYICLISGVFLGLWVLLIGGYVFGKPIPDVDKMKEIQPFFTGLIAPLLTLGTTLLVLANLRATTEQNFSTNFLKLIDLHNKLIENISTTVDGISSEKMPSKGRAFFDDIAHRIANDFYSLKYSSYAPPSGKLLINTDLRNLAKDKEGKELLLTIYDYYFNINRSDLSHYFRNLYHIVNFAENSKVSSKLKFENIKILRAQLSNYEILILAYNGLSKNGIKFYPLIEKYQLLKSLNSENTLSELRTKRIVDFEILLDSYPCFKSFYEE